MATKAAYSQKDLDEFRTALEKEKGELRAQLSEISGDCLGDDHRRHDSRQLAEGPG